MDATPKWKLEMDRPRLKSLMDLFHVQKPVIGMVHLWPLPGARAIRDTACEQSSTTACVTQKHW